MSIVNCYNVLNGREYFMTARQRENKSSRKLSYQRSGKVTEVRYKAFMPAVLKEMTQLEAKRR